MKLKIPSLDLSDGLRKVLNVVSSRSTIPVLSNVLLKAANGHLSLSTTDLEVSITTSIEAKIEEEGETTLPAKKFGQIVSTLPTGEVTLETDASMTSTISCNQARFKIMGLDSSEYPKEAAVEEDRKLTFSKVELGKIFRKISYAVSTDQTRYVLNGILLSIREGNFTAVATDGRRLALVEKILEDANSALDGDVILPIKVVNELMKLLDGEGDVVVKLSDSRALFDLGDTQIITKLVEGTYPNYRQVIPASFKNTSVVNRDILFEVLNRVSIVVTDGASSVKARLENTSIILSATSSDVGEASEPLEHSYEGEPSNIAFNPAYLKDPLRTLECDEITLKFNDEFKPVVILGDEGFLYVIMPMRN
jgi:DNA polymerase III subunit beta